MYIIICNCASLSHPLSCANQCRGCMGNQPLDVVATAGGQVLCMVAGAAAGSAGGDNLSIVSVRSQSKGYKQLKAPHWTFLHSIGFYPGEGIGIQGWGWGRGSGS